MALTTCELTWLMSLLKDLGLKKMNATTLKCDNQVALSIAANHVYHERTKHIQMDCHFIREKVNQGIIQPFYVPLSEQLADVLTKALAVNQHRRLLGKMGVQSSLHSHLERERK